MLAELDSQNLSASLFPLVTQHSCSSTDKQLLSVGTDSQYMHSLICMQRPTFLLFVLERDAPGDEVSSSAALLSDDLPHLVMAVGALEGCLRRGANEFWLIRCTLFSPWKTSDGGGYWQLKRCESQFDSSYGAALMELPTANFGSFTSLIIETLNVNELKIPK